MLEWPALTGLLRQVGSQVSLSGTSRFMMQAAGQAEDLGRTWQRQFHQEMTPVVASEHARLRRGRQKKRGRPKQTMVTEPALSLPKGYLIGDARACPEPAEGMSKRRGKKMGGLGRHYSGAEKKTVTGHSLVQGLYLLLGRRCPLTPQMYRQRAVCEAEGVPFASKIDIMAEIIRTFVPVPGTLTQVLVDSWYGCKRVWKIALARGFHITSGSRGNRSLRIEDPVAPKGWRWQQLDAYAAALLPAQWQRVQWPNQKGTSWVEVHVVSTRIKKLYHCQLVIIRGQMEEDEEETTRSTHWCHFIDWMYQQFNFGYQSADLYQELTGASL